MITPNFQNQRMAKLEKPSRVIKSTLIGSRNLELIMPDKWRFTLCSILWFRKVLTRHSTLQTSDAKALLLQKERPAVFVLCWKCNN